MKILLLGQTDRQTDISRLIYAFRNFVNAPKNLVAEVKNSGVFPVLCRNADGTQSGVMYHTWYPVGCHVPYMVPSRCHVPYMVRSRVSCTNTYMVNFFFLVNNFVFMSSNWVGRAKV
jgi:hypothetical protein